MVGCGVTARPRELDERLDVGGTVTTSGSGGPPRPMATTTTSLLGREQAGEMARDRGLPDSLAGTDDRDRRARERRALGRIEAEVRADVRNTQGEHATHEREALFRAEHRLVREIDDDVRVVAGDRRLDVRHERHAVLLAAAQLLLAADEDRGREFVRQLRERVTDDRGVVLAVDDRDRPHVRAVTSSSMTPVNFAYSSVSSENETSRSCPWNGCRRQTSTFRSTISMTL